MASDREAEEAWTSPNGKHLELIPWSASGEYFGGIEACFPDYGGRAMFRWYAGRGFAGLPAPDRLGVRAADGRLIAGVGINYRDVIGPVGFAVRAGVLSNAWTLPGERNRGLFQTLITEAIGVCRIRGCQLLGAFVAESNASFHAFTSLGLCGVPTAYCVTDTPHDDADCDLLVAEPAGEASVSALANWRPRQRASGFQFAYSDAEWLGQFVEKPQPVRRLQHPSGAWAIVEQHPTTLRINVAGYADPAQLGHLLRALGGLAHRSGLALFGYATQAADAEAYAAAGFSILPGRLILAATGAEIDRLFDPDPGWALQSGDRL